jgi:hypothetical protein
MEMIILMIKKFVYLASRDDTSKLGERIIKVIENKACKIKRIKVKPCEFQIGNEENQINDNCFINTAHLFALGRSDVAYLLDNPGSNIVINCGLIKYLAEVGSKVKYKSYQAHFNVKSKVEMNYLTLMEAISLIENKDTFKQLIQVKNLCY